MNPINLAGFVKRAYPNFNMNYFNNRLKLQKFIYLVQATGLNLGYNFRLYLRGPYSTMLAREGFEMISMEESNELKFEDVESEKKFSDMLSFIQDKKDDSDVMEILASLLLFHKIYPDKTEENLVKLVEEKSPRFNGQGQKIKKYLSELKACAVLSW